MLSMIKQTVSVAQPGTDSGRGFANFKIHFEEIFLNTKKSNFA